nr:hypothetical protein B0A51_16858 [Rachicladosporium sp. CCFEE 5018]
MSTSIFTTHRTLRNLHSTVHRNLSRQLRRHESTKPPSTPKPSTPARNLSTASTNSAPKTWTIPGPAWSWIEPLMPPFRAYGRMQQRSPLLTQFESSLTIYFLGDLSAQAVFSSGFKEGSYEPARGLRALLIGGLSSIPSYKWFMFLGTHFNYSSHLASLAVKILINQTFFTPIFNTYFFGMQSLLSGSTLQEAKERVIETVPVSWRNSWKVWPAVTAFSFTFVPPQYRNVFAGGIAVGWQTYLSWLNKNAEGKGQKTVEVKGAGRGKVSVKKERKT